MQSNGETGGAGAGGEVAPLRPPRVFVALKIAADLAQALACLSAEIAGPAVSRIAPADIHLTLVPPWREPSIPAAVAKIRCIAESHAPFELAFEHVGYGPEPRRPRLLWADCTARSELAALRAALLAAFGLTDERPFRPHVTLARIRGNGAAVARRHPLDRDLALAQRITSVELMQSPPQGGNGYMVLASLPLAVARAPS
jgi:2'-5' RNA ligase